MQYKEVFPIASLAQGLQSTSGFVMIMATPPTSGILANPGLFLVSSQLSEVLTSIKEMVSTVTKGQ